MHEASVAKDVLEIILDTVNADKNLQNKNLTKITFSQSFPPTVVTDSFEFYFTELIKGTVLDGAELYYKESREHGFFITSIEVED